MRVRCRPILTDCSSRRTEDAIAIWVGDRDPNFPVDVVEATRRLYAANGYEIKLNLIPNHDHNYYAISDQVNGKAWDFLKNARAAAGAACGRAGLCYTLEPLTNEFNTRAPQCDRQ